MANSPSNPQSPGAMDEAIGHGQVVTLQYVLTKISGEELDRSTQDEPFLYLHGFGQIVPGLERQLEGLKVGAVSQITVAAKDAYGEVIPDLKMRVSRTQFPADAEIAIGMEFAAQVEEGTSVPFRVTGVDAEWVEIDGNHPLAGEGLVFNVEIQSVRSATAEELSHGHAHPPGFEH